jgi:hypothetical protein
VKPFCVRSQASPAEASQPSLVTGLHWKSPPSGTQLPPEGAISAASHDGLQGRPLSSHPVLPPTPVVALVTEIAKLPEAVTGPPTAPVPTGPEAQTPP